VEIISEHGDWNKETAEGLLFCQHEANKTVKARTTAHVCHYNDFSHR